jgi:hypothetical protein
VSRFVRPHRRLVVVASLALLPAVGTLARAQPDRAPRPDDPALHLAERLERHMQERAASLRRESFEHYALIYEVDDAEVRQWLAPVSSRPDGDGVVLGVDGVPELHGGGILAFLLEHWRPQARAATPEDRFFFQGRGLALATLYAGHRRQVFLPVPGRPVDAIAGALPDRPQLARMRFPAATPGGQPFERDAYSFLRLLVTREDDFAAAWVNGVGQRLSVDLLLQQARDSWWSERSAGAEAADHSRLHLVEIFLAYGRRRSGAPDARFEPNAIKARFLEVELARADAEADDERLGHYAESLGFLVSDPRVTWSPDERVRVQAWLRDLDERRFRDLGAVEARHLTHLLRGLRMLGAHPSRLALP